MKRLLCLDLTNGHKEEITLPEFLDEQTIKN